MKKNKIISAAIALALGISALTSCASNQTEPAADKDNELDVTQTQEEPSDTASGDEKTNVVVSGQRAAPDLYRTLAKSKLVIKGEVLEKGESHHSNPDGTLVNDYGDSVTYATVTPYTVRVDEVYRGDVKPGDVIVVNTLNDNYLPADADEKYQSVESDISNVYLDVGEETVLCLGFATSYFPAGTTAADAGYTITGDVEGVFVAEPQNEEQKTAAVDSDGSGNVWYSEFHTIDLNTLTGEIDTAISKAAKYGVDENADSIGYIDNSL